MQYIVVHDWMCNELDLSGNNLLVFALIHGFSQDGESRFKGSRRYIANTLNISLPTVDKCLKYLLKLNYIEQHTIEQGGLVLHEYNALYGVKKLYTPSKETLHNNNIYNKDNNVLISNDINTTENVENSTDSPENFLGSLKKKQPKVNLYKKCLGAIAEKTSDIEIQKLLNDFLDYILQVYKDANKQLYPNIFRSKLNMLDKYDKADWKDLIEYALQKGWQGFYPIPKIGYAEDNYSVPTMTQEDYEALNKVIEERNRNGLRTSF